MSLSCHSHIRVILLTHIFHRLQHFTHIITISYIILLQIKEFISITATPPFYNYLTLQEIDTSNLHTKRKNRSLYTKNLPREITSQGRLYLHS